MTETNLITLTADIVAAHISNNPVAAADLPELIHSVHDALARSTQPPVADATPQEPAVSVRASIKPDYLVCLEDGAKLKMLKRYLRTNYDMSPDEYRAKWGLPRDYPMVAPNYAETRRTLAHKIGLGRNRGVAPAQTNASPTKSAGRKRLGVSIPKSAEPVSEPAALPETVVG